MHRDEHVAYGGIIPARAGSTIPNLGDVTKVEDHPRSCGEHPDFLMMCRIASGSSPLVRGALSTALSSVSRPGIIPARAGSTECRWQRAARLWDHPRSCGEHSEPEGLAGASAGSSPLVRGAQVSSTCRDRPPRIIPARAGSTVHGSFERVAAWDHPRSCGEHANSGADPSLDWGSSPLVRGARAQRHVGPPSRGIIPARAGSTL